MTFEADIASRLPLPQVLAHIVAGYAEHELYAAAMSFFSPPFTSGVQHIRYGQWIRGELTVVPHADRVTVNIKVHFTDRYTCRLNVTVAELLDICTDDQLGKRMGIEDARAKIFARHIIEPIVHQRKAMRKREQELQRWRRRATKLECLVSRH